MIKFLQRLVDAVFVIGALYTLTFIGHEVYIGGSKIGKMVLPLITTGYLIVTIPYILGRFLFKSKKSETERH